MSDTISLRSNSSASESFNESTSTYSVLPPPTICTSSMMTRYHSHITSGLRDLFTELYCTNARRGRTGGARATPRSCCRTLYVVMHTSNLFT